MTITALDTLDAAFDFGIGYLPDITELSIARTGGVTWIYGHTSNPDDGFITMSMSNAGALNYVANTGATAPVIYRSYDETDPTGFEAITIDGDFYLVGSNAFEVDGAETERGLHFYEVQADGSLLDVASYVRGADTSAVSDVVKIGTEVLTFEVQANANGEYDTLIVLNDGFGSSFAPPSFGNADIFTVAKDDGDAVLFYTREDNHRLSWVSVTTSGRGLFQGSVLGSDINGASGVATDMDTVNFGNQSFLITTNAQFGLRSYDVDDLGTELVDSVGAGASVADWEAAEIATFSFEGRNFVATGGKDIAVFEISDKGEFYLDSKIFHDFEIASDIEVHAAGGNAYIVVSGSEGVASFKFEPGPAQNQTGTPENDVLIGDSRDNVLSGYRGQDILKGAGGDDTLYGNQGSDEIFGGKGADRLRGAEGKDKLFGGGGADYVDGQDGNDRANGGGGDDDLFGGSGADRLDGGNGADFLNGGNGEDILKGGKGKDRLLGGSKSDTFIFAADGKADTIVDWENRDQIKLTGFDGSVRFRDLSIEQHLGNGLKVSVDGQSIVVTNAFRALDPSDLTAQHFDFG